MSWLGICWEGVDMAADPSHKVLVILGPDLLARSTAKAKRKGMTRSEYIRQLIEVDLGDIVATATGDPWAGQVTIEDAIVEAIVAEPYEEPA